MKLPLKALHLPQRTETSAELRDAKDRLIAVFERIEDAQDELREERTLSTQLQDELDALEKERES